MIEDHVDDSVSRGNTRSNISGSSDMVANGVEDSSITQPKSSHASVSL